MLLLINVLMLLLKLVGLELADHLAWITVHLLISCSRVDGLLGLLLPHVLVVFDVIWHLWFIVLGVLAWVVFTIWDGSVRELDLSIDVHPIIIWIHIIFHLFLLTLLRVQILHLPHEQLAVLFREVVRVLLILSIELLQNFVFLSLLEVIVRDAVAIVIIFIQLHRGVGILASTS